MKIIFVCTGNTCRSPMAEYIARANNDKDVFESRGIAADDGQYPAYNAVQALKEMGINMLGHRAKQFTEQDADADKFICMDLWGKMFLIEYFDIPEDKVSVLGNGISDPHGQDVYVYRERAKEIDEELAKLEYFN